MLQTPQYSGSDYFNYKWYFSIVPLAIVDANVSIRCQGRISDGGVFSSTAFKKSLETSCLRFTIAKALPGRSQETPFVVIADEAFPLQPKHDEAKGSPEKITILQY